ncbi:MAG: hypothetical protein FWE37_01260 [Spirochaetaceae bacterium]|nr:hypothetical protein [Spirochaetaceae bacterium]
MTIFYFTATGNCLYVAGKIGGNLISIPQELKGAGKSYEDDAIGFVWPCWGAAVPKPVQRFMEQSSFKANYFFNIMTYGNIPGNGLGDMQSWPLKQALALIIAPKF